MLEERLKVALEIAQRAGEYALQNQKRITSVDEKKRDTDLVTNVDREVQELITEELKNRFPQDTVWGEESGYPLQDFSSTWVIDPIDGTANFMHKIPFFSVSIAYFEKGSPVIGVIFAPNFEESFYACRGKGAFLNGEPITVSEVKNLNRAIFGTGLPHSEGAWKRIISLYASLLPRCQAIRSLGSAALGVAYVACGRMEGYFQADLSFYDIAAGICIAQEAGALIFDLAGNPWSAESHSLLVLSKNLSEASRTFITRHLAEGEAS